MEAAAAARGSSMPMPPPPSRKEWRAVSDHHSARNIGDEELERSKLGQSDERTIYEVQQGREPVDVDFCSITVDGTLDHGVLQQRIEDISRQREELQHMEIDLKAQIIARSEIMEIQHNFDAQIKEHANAASKLQEQLHEREQTIHDLERKMDEKDRELHAIKLDNEAAWAKEDLLREQNKELANIRRERDHSEAERTQHIQQLHDLQEHIQEKERQLNDLREQHRLAQEAIHFKDERLREAQAWITRVQEMDALQSTTIQAELRERTEQYNQLWLGCQRQFAEMERHHMHTVQQLQLELADARERSGAYTDESHMTQSNSKDASQFGQNNRNQLDMNTSNGNTGPLQNGNSDDVSSFASTGNASTQIEHVAGVPISPSSLLGMPSYLPPGQVTALHPFLMHQQGVPHSVPPHVPQSHVGHFHSIPAISSLQQWQNQQAPSEGLQISTQNELPSSQNDPNLIRPDANYNYETSGNGQFLQQDYLDAQINQGAQPDSVLSSSTGEPQVIESIDRGYLVSSQPDQSLQQISSQFRNALRLESLEQNSETKVPEHNVQTSTDHGLDGQVLTAEQPSSTTNSLKSDNSIPSVNIRETAIDNATSAVLPEAFVSTGHANAAGGQTSEIALLDERSLLACMVRTIPAGGRIRISSTLPNRLGKMLAPLHWHDYKKKFGKLDDFVAGHHELFVIEGDYIQLREGAQEMIAATAAVAKVAAAAAASSPYSSSLPSVAITPVAQTHRSRKISTLNANDNHLQSVKQNQQLNGLSFGISGGFSNVKILSKSNDSWEPNGPDTRPSQSSVLMNGGNGALTDRSSMSSTQSSGLPNGRLNSNAVGKHGRMTNAAAFTSRR